MSLAQLRRTLAELADVSEPAVKAACTAVEKIAVQEGGTVVLGRKRKRVKLKAITRVKDHGAEVVATVWGVPTGPWVWANTGANPHAIPKRKPTAKRPRPMQGDGFEHPVQRVQVHHPGTGGRGAWRKVVARAERVVPEIIGQAVHEVVRRG